MDTPCAWWTDATGYQVYLPSFADSDGDGWGDLDGLTSRLGYLAGLGVDLVWLTPFFVSPMRDHGYDIADYLRVDPAFGGDEAFDRLVAEARRLGIRLIGDLVVNHTSDQHRWFRAATAEPAGRYRDYYIWRDPGPGGGPPNNWLSHFGGPAWTFEPTSGQYYLHLFRPEQPDLNWQHPAVADEVDAIIEHWIRRGLDGFRIDTAGYLAKHPDLPDNPLRSTPLANLRGVTADWLLQDHVHDIHQPAVHAIHARWRKIADRYGAFLVGEVYELDPVALSAYVATERLHSSFWFGLVESEWDPGRIADLVRGAATTSAVLSWAQSNHDRRRSASRYGGGLLGAERSVALQTLLEFLPGTSWLYQGEELGLTDGVVPAYAAADPLGAADPEQSRDGARTPMPWRPGPGLGFTAGTPWLPDGDRGPADTVEWQSRDPGSPLCSTRRLLATRNRIKQDGLIAGTAVRWLGSAPGVLVFRRSGITVAANLNDHAGSLPALDGVVAFDAAAPDTTIDRPRAAPQRLHPRQAIVLIHPTGHRDEAG